jgi:hypothetical protein
MESCETCKYQNKAEHEEPCKNCSHNATDNYEPITNADRIRSMTDEELAELLCLYDACVTCSHDGRTCNIMNCDEIGLTKKWLQSEVEDDTRTSN